MTSVAAQGSLEAGLSPAEPADKDMASGHLDVSPEGPRAEGRVKTGGMVRHGPLKPGLRRRAAAEHGGG